MFKKWSKTHVSNRCTLPLAVTKLVVRKITSAIQRVEASQVVIHNFFSNSKYSISSRVNRARDTVRLANVHWSFRTQNSRSKNVFLKSSYPKSSWILINPESFPRCKLQRNNKREVLELRKPLVGPFGFWMHKNSEFWKKFQHFQNFERTEILSARNACARIWNLFRKFFEQEFNVFANFWGMSVGLWNKGRPLRNWRYRSNLSKPKDVTPKMQP